MAGQRPVRPENIPDLGYFGEGDNGGMNVEGSLDVDTFEVATAAEGSQAASYTAVFSQAASHESSGDQTSAQDTAESSDVYLPSIPETPPSAPPAKRGRGNRTQIIVSCQECRRMKWK